MKLYFHGAAQTVTGSKHVIELESGEKLLLDCGMFQGLGKDTFGLNNYFGFNPSDLNHMILSHAHIDHSGLIPKLVKDGYKGNIYCTEATYDLCRIMLADSAYIQEQDIRYVNKRRKKQDRPPLEPLYNFEDVQNALKQFVPVKYNHDLKIADKVVLEFIDVGHILGSASVNLRFTEGSDSKRLHFTGDVGRYGTALLHDPNMFPQADVVICESTYGNRLHDDLQLGEQKILQAVNETCVRRKGKLIIPAFSLGRTQEVVYALNKLDVYGLLPEIKIFVDSPLSVNATEIMRAHTECLNHEVHEFIEKRPDPFGFGKLTYITEIQESQKLNKYEGPCIIISASGMGEAGRIKHHILHAITNPANTILLVGYAEPESLNGKLRRGAQSVRIFGEFYDVRAEVVVIDSFSAHGDYKELIKYLSCQDPEKVKKTFLVHGEPESQETFKEHLHEVGFKNIFIPAQHSGYYG